MNYFSKLPANDFSIKLLQTLRNIFITNFVLLFSNMYVTAYTYRLHCVRIRALAEL